MPGWLTWLLVGVATWLVASVPVAFLAVQLLVRGRSRRRALVGAAPVAILLRVRPRLLKRTG
jgi:hypothetical protein